MNHINHSYKKNINLERDLLIIGSSISGFTVGVINSSTVTSSVLSDIILLIIDIVKNILLIQILTKLVYLFY